MDKIYEELEELKVEAEKLREECRAKTELSDCLRKAHNQQQAKIREMKLETERLSRELHAKSEEICEIRQLYEELQSSLQRKEVFMQEISSANKNLRAEYGENILKLEGENRGLVLALDEALERIKDLEKKMAANDEEISGLKRLLSVKPGKNIERPTIALNDLGKRDEYILKLEEENRIAQEKMKWKNEQFSHLEEAHRKLQAQFQVNKDEWGKEKSAIIDEISSLQASLDTQVWISESLKVELRMCEQALAREQSKRKILEIEVSESRSLYDNVFHECQLAKSEIGQLPMKRDEEIGELRSLLREKDILANGMKYRTSQLEQENKVLMESLKDFQEAQISNRATSSSKKLLDRFRALEHLHSKCGANFKKKEADLNHQIEKLTLDLKSCLFELGGKNKCVGEIQKELEDCQWQLEVKNEEIFMLMMVVKSEFYVGYSKLYEAKESLDMFIEELEERNMLLKQQLQIKDIELHEVNAQLKQRCEEISVLTEDVLSFDYLQQKNNLLEENLDMYRGMLEDSNELQLRLKQRVIELENAEGQNRKETCDSLEKVELELVNKTAEVEKYKLELQKWKNEVDNLKLKFEDNRQALVQENSNLHVKFKDQDIRIGKLMEQIHMLESVLAAKNEGAKMQKEEKDIYRQIAGERECIIENLWGELVQIKNELAEKDTGNLALSDACEVLRQEKETLLSYIRERDQKLLELEKKIESLDVNLRTAEISFTAKEGILVETIKRVQDQNIIEIEEKNQILANLKKEVHDLRNEMALQERALLQSQQNISQLDSSLRAKTSEMEELVSQFEKERRGFESLVEELQSQKQSLLEDLNKLSTDRKDLLVELEGICEQMGLFYDDNEEWINILGKMFHLPEEDDEPEMSLTSVGPNETAFSPSRKLIHSTADERIPLTELNC